MPILVLKKFVFVLLVLLLFLGGDLLKVYGVRTQMEEALENAADATAMAIVDNRMLAFADWDTHRADYAEDSVFREVLFEELNLEESGTAVGKSDDGFYRHGVHIKQIEVGWRDDYPAVWAEISTEIDTMILGQILPGITKVTIDNRDHFYWQWAN